MLKNIPLSYNIMIMSVNIVEKKCIHYCRRLNLMKHIACIIQIRRCVTLILSERRNIGKNVPNGKNYAISSD